MKRLMVLVACWLVLGVAVGMTAATPACAEADFESDVGRMYSVDCYIGAPASNRNIGSISVSEVSSAGALCNATFIDCKGKCVGCVNDFDLDGTVCYDNAGKKFLQ